MPCVCVLPLFSFDISLFFKVTSTTHTHKRTANGQRTWDTHTRIHPTDDEILFNDLRKTVEPYSMYNNSPNVCELYYRGKYVQEILTYRDLAFLASFPQHVIFFLVVCYGWLVGWWCTRFMRSHSAVKKERKSSFCLFLSKSTVLCMYGCVSFR